MAVRFRPVPRRRRPTPLALVALVLIVGALTLARTHAGAARGQASARAAAAPAPTPTATPSGTATADAGPVLAILLLAHPTATPTTAPTAAPPPATSTPIPAPTPFYSSTWLQAHPAPQPPRISARAAIVVDYDTHRILYALNPDERMAQASTTKITLADVALDVASPDLPITIGKDATEVVPDHMGVQVGEVLTLQELLYGALLDSGNDAGWAIAEGIGGLDHTVALMNQKAVSLHLHDTHYANPVGFDDPQHYTSAYDLAVLTADALTRHPLFRQIVSTKKEIIESTKTHGWFGPINLNALLWDYPGAWGVKPGWTENAGYCLVAAATRNGHTVLVTLLGSKDHFADGTALLNYGFARIAADEN